MIPGAADAACPVVRMTPVSNPASPIVNVPTADQTDTGSAARRLVGAISEELIGISLLSFTAEAIIEFSMALWSVHPGVTTMSMAVDATVRNELDLGA